MLADILQTSQSRPVTVKTDVSGNGGGRRETSGSAVAADDLTLSPEAEAQLRKLRQRDAEVRAHEQAHIAAGGPYVSGGPHYDYQRGPDGRQYAIGGHVDIDVSPVPNDPEGTRKKAEQVRRAATAPGEPSGQDRQVAAEAAALALEAQHDASLARRREDAGVTAPAADSRAGNAQPAQEGALPPPAELVEQVAEAGTRGQGHAGPGTDPAARRDSRRSRAAQAYADISLRDAMPTAVAMGGTGISMAV